MSIGNTAFDTNGAELNGAATRVIGGSDTGFGAEMVIDAPSVIGRAKEPEDSCMIPEVDDDIPFMIDGNSDVIAQTIGGASTSQQHVLEKHAVPTKLSYRKKVQIFNELQEAYEGHVDEMELYGAMIAQTSKIKGGRQQQPFINLIYFELYPWIYFLLIERCTLQSNGVEPN
jgi:hypothetical protein